MPFPRKMKLRIREASGRRLSWEMTRNRMRDRRSYRSGSLVLGSIINDEAKRVTEEGDFYRYRDSPLFFHKDDFTRREAETYSRQIGNDPLGGMVFGESRGREVNYRGEKRTLVFLWNGYVGFSD